LWRRKLALLFAVASVGPVIPIPAVGFVIPTPAPSRWRDLGLGSE
jgi:hypothetical protein